MTDDPRALAFDPHAPAPERRDALAALTRQIGYGALAPADLQPVIDWIADDLEQQSLAKAKVIPFPNDERSAAKAGMQSVALDRHQLSVMGDWFEPPGAIGMDALRTLVEQTPVLSAVVLTRIRQIARFCQPSEDGGPGFEIRHIDRKHEITPDEERSLVLLSRFFQHCGWEFNPRHRRALHRDNFQQFMAKLVRDSLVLDAAPIETEMKRQRQLGIDGLYAVDGASIRLCTEDGYAGDDRFFAVQIVQGQVRTAYTRDDLIYEPRNPRADLRLAGYGLSETELLIRVVTGFLNAMTLNIKGFSDNSIPRGILHLSGNYSQEDLIAFKRYWNQTVKGINNAWALPVMVSKDQESKAAFEPINAEFNEMYFGKWMTFLTSLICAVYGMSPDEINFESFTAGKSSLSGSDTAEKLADSKDKGLRPLLSYFESIFTDFIVTDFSDKYVFRWVGLDEADEQKEWEAKKLVLTVNELRAEQGYDALDGPLGEAPLNPSLIGPWMQIQQAQQPEDFGQAPDAAGPGGEQDGQQGPPNQDGDQDDEQDPNQGDRQNPPTSKQEPAQGPNEKPDKPAPFGKALPSIYSLY